MRAVPTVGTAGSVQEIGCWVILGRWPLYEPKEELLSKDRTRIACPAGHRRQVSRDTEPAPEIRCEECGKQYPIAWDDQLSSFLYQGSASRAKHFVKVGEEAGPWARILRSEAGPEPFLPDFNFDFLLDHILTEVIREASPLKLAAWLTAEIPPRALSVGLPRYEWTGNFVDFRLDDRLVPARPLRQLQYAAAAITCTGKPLLDQDSETFLPSVGGYSRARARRYLKRLKETLLPDSHPAPQSTAQRLERLRHAIVSHRMGSNERTQALKKLKRLWEDIGKYAGVIPPSISYQVLIPDRVLMAAYDKGVELAKKLRAYDPAKDRRVLAGIEPLKDAELDSWASVFHLGGLFTPAEVDTLLKSLPGAITGSPNPSVGVHVVDVLATRLGVDASHISDRLRLPASVGNYVER